MGQWSSGYNARRNVNIFNDFLGENVDENLAGILHDFFKTFFFLFIFEL